MVAASGHEQAALVLVAKYPGSGASKTRLVKELAVAAAGTADPSEELIATAQEQAAAFSRASVMDLVRRFSDPALNCARTVLYAPPVDAARDYFSEILSEVSTDLAANNDINNTEWMLLPATQASDARSSDLSTLLSDAMARARAASGCRKVVFIGSDCPDLPISSLCAALSKCGEPHTASLFPALDGGYTLLALPAEAEEGTAFDGVHWSSTDTALSQLAALSRAGLRCHVGCTHEDVDELKDLRALHCRLLTSVEAAETCPYTAAVCTTLRSLLDTAPESND